MGKSKMKFSPALLFAVAAADDKKVPPRHPLQRLERLTQFTDELLTTWFTFIPSMNNWVNKFANNAARMERNFNRGNQRCGFYDQDQLPHGGPERKRRGAIQPRGPLHWCPTTDHWLQQVGRAILVAMLGSSEAPTSSLPHEQVEQTSPGSSCQPGRYVMKLAMSE